MVEVHKLTKIEPDTGDYIFLDLISAISTFSQEILSQRRRLDWKGRQLWIVSREGLIKLKEAAKRPKDILDLDNLKAETE
jgi:hypothetical protein